jgi:hypothetical protein
MWWLSALVGNQTSKVDQRGRNQTSVGLTSDLAYKVENYLVTNPKLFPTKTFKSLLVGNPISILSTFRRFAGPTSNNKPEKPYVFDP